MKLKTNVPHPIPYQGSKRQLAGEILSQFPDQLERLVEPFAGSAAVSLAAAYHRKTTAFCINDAHQPLVDLWREIIERPEQLARQYRRLWQAQQGNERQYYDDVRERFNQTHRPVFFLYLLARCVKAAIRYNGNGEFNNSPDNRRLGARPETMRERVVGASLLLHGRTQVTNDDYLRVLENCTPGDLIYMDPPYQGVCGNRDNRYAPKFSHHEFCEALDRLNQKGCLYIVSYDGRTGTKTYGEPMPKHLQLGHVEVYAGRSTQATLLGRSHDTFESLYFSPALVATNSRRIPRVSNQKKLSFT